MLSETTPRPAVMRHARRMEEKLRQNDQKGRGEWVTVPLADLLDGLQAEIEELYEAWEQKRFEELKWEAADVSNFCLMLVDNIELRNESRGCTVELDCE